MKFLLVILSVTTNAFHTQVLPNQKVCENAASYIELMSHKETRTMCLPIFEDEDDR